LEPPADVLEEWERVHGIDGLTGAGFRADLESVTARLAVGTAESVHNANNRVLVEGATALGHEVMTLPRNVRGCGDGSRCGPCVYGCPWGAKRDALQTWVRDAAAAGARILVHCEAQRLVARHGAVTAVEATFREPATGARHRVEVRAKTVVLAGGAIFSPALLLRSGLGNARVGTGLRIHPVTVCLGVYDRRIEIWKGPAQTAVVTTSARSHNGTHGFWLEAAPGHPGIAAMAVPWRGREEHQASMRRLSHTSALIVLVRDVASGRVTINRHGDPLVRYRLTPSDQALLIGGLQELGRIHLAAGAQEVYTLHTAGVGVERDQPGAAVRFADAVARAGIRPNALTMFTAHLMGAVPMGAHPRLAAVDPSGRLYGVTNLFVADASVFPSAPAVNPMITIMAMARRIAARIP
jgi:choline dehydrogenase-like flavoprotein